MRLQLPHRSISSEAVHEPGALMSGSQRGRQWGEGAEICLCTAAGVA